MPHFLAGLRFLPQLTNESSLLAAPSALFLAADSRAWLSIIMSAWGCLLSGQACRLAMSFHYTTHWAFRDTSLVGCVLIFTDLHNKWQVVHFLKPISFELVSIFNTTLCERGRWGILRQCKAGICFYYIHQRRPRAHPCLPGSMPTCFYFFNQMFEIRQTCESITVCIDLICPIVGTLLVFFLSLPVWDYVCK